MSVLRDGVAPLRGLLDGTNVSLRMVHLLVCRPPHRSRHGQEWVIDRAASHSALEKRETPLPTNQAGASPMIVSLPDECVDADSAR